MIEEEEEKEDDYLHLIIRQKHTMVQTRLNNLLERGCNKL